MPSPINDQLQTLARDVADLVGPYLLRTFYEQAAYTPTYVGGTSAGVTTYSTQEGVYIRIGALVVASVNLVWSAATGTGEVRISLPFTVASSVAISSGFARYSAVTWTGTAPQVVLNSGTLYLRMQGVSSDAGATIATIEPAGAAAITAIYLTS